MLQESQVTAEPSCRLTHTRCQCSVMLMTYCLLSLLATAFAVKPWQHQSWKSCVNFCKNIFNAKSSRKSPETSEISTNLQMIQPFSSTVFCDHHKTFKTPAKSRSKFVCHFYTEILQRSQKQDRKTPQKAASPERASLVRRRKEPQYIDQKHGATWPGQAENAAPRQGMRNSQTPPKSELRHSKKQYLRRVQSSTFGTP